MKRARLRGSDTLFVCGKCLKRHPDAKALRRALKRQVKSADAKLVRTTCFGICPKKAVAVADRASVADGRTMLVRDVDEIADVVRAMRDRHSFAVGKTTG